jgi:glycerol-3-phosphate cytidylyltransferase
MLAEAKKHCDYLICGLQTDPTIDRPDSKNTPVQSIIERQIQLNANKNVDQIIVYQTEKDLEDILLTLDIDVRIIGQEYEYEDFTGRDICSSRQIDVIYNTRDHDYSTTNLRKRVLAAEARNGAVQLDKEV